MLYASGWSKPNDPQNVERDDRRPTLAAADVAQTLSGNCTPITYRALSKSNGLGRIEHDCPLGCEMPAGPLRVRDGCATVTVVTTRMVRMRNEEEQVDLETLAAELEIRRVLARYCRGVDRGDLALLKSVYHPDARDDHGMFVGSGWDFAEALVPAMDGSSLNSQHHLTNVLIELDGDAAAVESYVIAFHPARDPQSGEEVHHVAGARYLDRFEKRDGAWKIAERRVVIDWTRAGTPAPAWPAWQGVGLHGARREQDPSHQLFDGAAASPG